MKMNDCSMSMSYGTDSILQNNEHPIKFDQYQWNKHTIAIINTSL